MMSARTGRGGDGHRAAQWIVRLNWAAFPPVAVGAIGIGFFPETGRCWFIGLFALGMIMGLVARGANWIRGMRAARMTADDSTDQGHDQQPDRWPSS